MIGFVICGKPEFSGEYKQVKLVDVCEILDSKRIPITKNKRVTGPYPYYGANGIQDHVADYLFDDELVLLAEDGGHFEKDGQIAYRVSGKCWVNNHAHILKAKDEIDVDYLCYALQSFDVSSLVNGATRKKLTQSAMKKMSLPLRPVDVQIAIVGNLKTIELQLGNARKLLSSLDDLVKSRFNEMFGDLEHGYKCPSRKLESIAQVGSSKRVFKNELLAEGIPFYRGAEIAELSAGGVVKPSLFISKEHYERLIDTAGKPEIGDLLLPSICPEGQIWCVNTDVPFYFKDGRVLWIRPNRDAVDGVYLRHALSTMFQMSFSNIASGTTFAELKIFLLKELEIPLPELKAQKEFVSFVRQVDKLRFMLLANPSPAFGGRLFCCSTNSCSGGVILDA